MGINIFLLGTSDFLVIYLDTNKSHCLTSVWIIICTIPNESSFNSIRMVSIMLGRPNLLNTNNKLKDKASMIILCNFCIFKILFSKSQVLRVSLLSKLEEILLAKNLIKVKLTILNMKIKDHQQIYRIYRYFLFYGPYSSARPNWESVQGPWEYIVYKPHLLFYSNRLFL